jgi:anti-anti-sigma factor
VDIEKSNIDGVVVVTLAGKLDVAGSQKAQEALVPAVTPGGKLVIDMTACDYVASSGLRVLLITAKQAAVEGCRAVLCGVQPLVWDVIVMTGFEDMLEAFPTQPDALAALA